MSRSTSLRRLCLCRPTSKPSSSMSPPLELHLTSLYSKALADVARADSKQPQLTVSKQNGSTHGPSRIGASAIGSAGNVSTELKKHTSACVHSLTPSQDLSTSTSGCVRCYICESANHWDKNSAKILNVTIRTHVLQDPRQQKKGCQPRRELEHVSFLQKLFLCSSPPLCICTLHHGF